MARMPGAKWLGEHSPRRPMRAYDRVIIHTIVGYAPVYTPHFSTDAEGNIYQARDTVYQSGVSGEGNPTSIGIENEDHGPAYGKWSGSNVPPFTPKQLEAIAKICAWAHKEHGVPLVACPDSRPGSKGIAYHRQGIDGNFKAAGLKYGGRVSGGEVWSSAYGKVCPGDARIAQIPQIIKRAREIAGLEKAQEEDPLAAYTEEQLKSLMLDALQQYGKYVKGKHDNGTAILVTNAQAERNTNRILRVVKENSEILAEMAKIVGNPGLSDADRAKLADEIAARVNKLRVSINVEEDA